MSQLEIRPYLESDEPEATALWKEAFPDEPARNATPQFIARKLGVQRELFLVGTRDGRVVATAIGGYDGVRGWVYKLAVAQRERGNGHGKAMMGELERRLAAIGCPKLNLQVRTSNRAVIAFYESLGYAIEERISMGKPLE